MSKANRKLFQMHSNSVDLPQIQKRQRRIIIPSLSITLPDGDIQSLDVSPLRAIEDIHSCGTLLLHFTMHTLGVFRVDGLIRSCLPPYKNLRLLDWYSATFWTIGMIL